MRVKKGSICNAYHLGCDQIDGIIRRYQMDPLSEILSLLRLQTYIAGGFVVPKEGGLRFQKFRGLKCYAVVANSCWLKIENVAEVIPLATGDCFILPSGRSFSLQTEPDAPLVDFNPEMAKRPHILEAGCAIIGGHFLLKGGQSEAILDTLPPVVHLRSEANKAAIRWSLEGLREELRNPQPGGPLIAQQIASVMLVQALRLHAQNEGADGVGWLAALVDTHVRIAINCMHDEPARPWTIKELADRAGMSRTVFAQRFRQRVGMTSMEYLTRWRMMLASDRLRNSRQNVSDIAWSVGYETDSAFGKAFKRVLGCSPRAYRQKEVEEHASQS